MASSIRTLTVPVARRTINHLSLRARTFSSPTAARVMPLTTSDGTTFSFPVAFLRENLTEAIDGSSLQRLSNNLPRDLACVAATQQGDAAWQLKFSDGAEGTFWLPPDQPAPDLKTVPRSLWGGAHGAPEHMRAQLYKNHLEGGLQFSWDELQVESSNDGELAAEQLGQGRAVLSPAVAAARSGLLEAVRKYGMAMVADLPAEPDMGVNLVDSIVGAVETTNFGYKFVIKNVKDPHNLAFHNIGLQHHQDFTYCKKTPDVAVFHCIKSAETGGDSLWLDSFAAAETLREADHAAFEVLCATPVLHMDITDKWDLAATHPTFTVDANGTLERVCFNERTRDSWRQWRGDAESNAAQSPEFYGALRQFEELVKSDKQFEINTPLEAGQMVLFDNNRIMHSRTAFEGARHMEGCYFDWGAAEATWRALQPQVSGEKYVYCGNTVGLPSKA